MNRQSPVSLPEGYLDFYKNLETWQNIQQSTLKKAYQNRPLDVQELLFSTNKPILASVNFELEPGQFKKTYSDLLLFLRKERPEIGGSLDKLENNLDHLNFDLLPVKLLEEDQQHFSALAEVLDVPVELVIFTVDHALRPYLRLWAEPYYSTIAQDDFKSWNFATICPFCGSKPHFSRIRGADGRRFMFCDRCFTEWETRNIYCIHCGNDNPHSIQYLSVDGDMAYQVYTCEECKGYIKTYDERQKGQLNDLFIANFETVYLDMLAQEKGYTSHDDN
ncbi:MAG: formate dehydrogenase accessory protein FdhE [Syntrophomonadaceae bacterium]|nr:formate dehydrogenase accessory protein FdhE [Syntrophomonadaceae bacterium]